MRIRIGRILTRRQQRATRLDLLLALVVSTVVVGVFVLGIYALMLHAGLRYDQIVDRSMLLVAALVLVAMSAGLTTMVLGTLAAIRLGYLTIGAPWLIFMWVRKLFAARRRDRYEATLERTGEIVLGPGEHRDRELLRALARADRALLFDAGANAVRVVAGGPPESCPRCNARLAHLSAGLRRCDHCRFERFDELLGRDEDLAKARAMIDKVQAGEVFSGDRAALWTRFKRAHASVMEPRTLLLLIGLTMFFALIGEIAIRGDVGALKAVARIGVVCFGFPAGIMAPIAVYANFSRRYRKFKPGVAAYDRAIALDIITTLAHQGVMPLDALAAHLGVSRGHLDEVLVSFERLGIAPAYHDTKHDRLISLHARAIDDAACPACGGQLAPGPHATLSCQHCGGHMLALVRPAAGA